MSPISCGWPRSIAQVMGLMLGVAGLSSAHSAHGADVRVYGRIVGWPNPDAGSAFDLHLAREDLAVAYADDSGGGDLRVGRIGVSFHEAIAPTARLGARIGRAGISQSDRAATAGLDPAGYYGELMFAGSWPRATFVGLDLRASWRYTSLRASSGDERTELDWQTGELRPALRISVSRAVTLRLGPTAIAVEGDERISGSSERTTGFRARGHSGGFLAAELYLRERDRRTGGVVTLRARGGNPAGVHASFETRY